MTLELRPKISEDKTRKNHLDDGMELMSDII